MELMDSFMRLPNLNGQTVKLTVFVGEKNIARQIRDGILGDESAHIPITVWSPLICKVVEDTPMKCKNVVVQYKYGTKVTTTATTVFEAVDDTVSIAVDWQTIPLTKELITSTVCCPDVISVKVTGYKSCVNIMFRKRLDHILVRL